MGGNSTLTGSGADQCAKPVHLQRARNRVGSQCLVRFAGSSNVAGRFDVADEPVALARIARLSQRSAVDADRDDELGGLRPEVDHLSIVCECALRQPKRAGECFFQLFVLSDSQTLVVGRPTFAPARLGYMVEIHEPGEDALREYQ